MTFVNKTLESLQESGISYSVVVFHLEQKEFSKHLGSTGLLFR